MSYTRMEPHGVFFPQMLSTLSHSLLLDSVVGNKLEHGFLSRESEAKGRGASIFLSRVLPTTISEQKNS